MPQINGKAKKEMTYDAIVVGAGITGGWASKELSEKGLKVLCLERGRNVEHVKDYPTAMQPPWKDQYGGRDSEATRQEYPIQSKNYAFSEETKQFFVKDTESPYTQVKPFYWIRGYQTGGKSLTWGRQCYRWSERDFEENARDGYGTDWPIRYKDVEPWYDYVEKYAGISGKAAGLPQVPDSPYFLPPMELNCVENLAKEKIESIYPDRKMIPGRLAHLTDDTHKERGRCQYRNMCVRGCPYGGYFSSVSSLIPDAQKTGNFTLRNHSIVTKVLFDNETQRATGVEVLDAETGETMEFFARIIFLCGSTLNTTWMLMHSTSSRFPNGLGNDSGVLGHYLMDHHFQVGATGEYEGMKDKYYYGRTPNIFLIPRYRNIGKDVRENYLRGFGMYGWGAHQGWGQVAAIKEAEFGFGAEWKDAITDPRNGNWTLTFYPFGECLPYEDNRVFLDLTKKDKWGLPVLAMDMQFRENEREMTKDMLNDGSEMLEAIGFKNISTFKDETAPGFGIHEMGTARMGRDSKTSILNGHNQLWAAKNVFITDGACMASSAFQNPSLTFMALTARACDFAVKELKKQNL